MHDVGMHIVKEKKNIVAKLGTGAGIDTSRDLLTLLIKANMDLSIPEDQRLSDEDVMARKSASNVIGRVCANNQSLCGEEVPT